MARQVPAARSATAPALQRDGSGKPAPRRSRMNPTPGRGRRARCRGRPRRRRGSRSRRRRRPARPPPRPSEATGTIGSSSPCTRSTGGRDDDLGREPRRAPAAAPRSRRCRRPAPPRRSPTCSAIIVPWLKPKSTVRSGGVVGGDPVEPGVEQARTRRPPASRRRLGRPVEPGDRKPLIAEGLLTQRCGRVRARRSGCPAGGRQRLGQADQVVAVGAVAVQEDHQAVGGAGGGRPLRPAE